MLAEIGAGGHLEALEEGLVLARRHEAGFLEFSSDILGGFLQFGRPVTAALQCRARQEFHIVEVARG